MSKFVCGGRFLQSWAFHRCTKDKSIPMKNIHISKPKECIGDVTYARGKRTLVLIMTALFRKSFVMKNPLYWTKYRSPSTSLSMHQVWLYWRSVIMKFSYIEVQLYWNSVILKFSYIEIQLYWSSVILKFSYIEVQLYWSSVILKFSYIEIQLYWSSVIMKRFHVPLKFHYN